MPNPDSDVAKAFREEFKNGILNDPKSAFAEFLANAEDATNSPDPVIASKGWERIRELMLVQSMLSGITSFSADNIAAIATQIKNDIQPEIDAVNKAHGDDYQTLNEKLNGLDGRIKSLETPLDPNPAPTNPAS